MNQKTKIVPTTQAIIIRVLIVIVFLFVVAGLAYPFWQKTSRHKTPSSQPQSLTSSATSSEHWLPTSSHPWSMFHGNYNHTGYADVAGPSTNQLKWKYLVGSTEGNWPNSVIVAKDGTVFVAGNNQLTALGADGSLKWAKEYPSSQGPSLSADGQTLYVAAGSSLVAASSADGSKKWEFKANGNMVFGPTIGPDGTIYQGSWDKYFYAINADGSLKWKYLTKGTISYPASIDQNGHIYLGGGDAHFGPDGNTYAFDQDGQLLWTYDTKMLRVGSPAIGPDGLIYLAASPKLIVLDQAGKLKWQKGPDVPLPTASGQTQAVSPGNGNVSGGGAVPPPPAAGISPAGPANNAAPCAPPPAPCGNAAGNAGGAPPAITGTPPNTTGGTNPDMANVEVIAGIITPALTPDGLIYIGNPQGKFMAIDAKTQEIKWSYQTGKNPEPGIDYGLPTFVLVDKNSTAYFGALDHKFYALGKDGKLKWSYTTGGKITEASPAFAADGTLYFTSEDGYLYAIGG